MSSWKKILTRKDIKNNLNNNSNPVTNSTITSQINSKANSIHTHDSDDVTDLLDAIYPIGSIYMSVNNVNPETLFGGFWEKIEDRFLLGSGSYNLGVMDGSADAIVPKHNHEQDAHNHTQNAHNHNYDGNGYVPYFNKNDNWGYSGKIQPSHTSGNHYMPYANENTGGVTEINTTGGTTGTNQNTTATNQLTGSSNIGKNMPPYLAVNIWRRLPNLVLSANKNFILTDTQGNLTVRYTKGQGHTLSVYSDENASNFSYEGNMTDNNDGTYSYNIIHDSEGNDITYYVTCDEDVSNRITVETCTKTYSLDGTEGITQIWGTTTVSDSVMYGGQGYLTDGWDNSGDWILEFDAKFDKEHGTGIILVKDDISRINENTISIGANGWGGVYNNSAFSSNYNYYNTVPKNWYHFKITKNNSTITINVNGVSTQITNWGPTTSASSLAIGVNTWETKEYGLVLGDAKTYIKNIRVTEYNKTNIITATKSGKNITFTVLDKNNNPLRYAQIDEIWLSPNGAAWGQVTSSDFITDSNGQYTMSINEASIYSGQIYAIKDGVTSNTVSW